MNDEPPSYVARKMSEVFKVTVLFSEPLQFTLSEIIDAAAEDYPALEVHKHFFVEESAGAVLHDTGQPVAATIFDVNAGGIMIFTTPGTPYDDDVTLAARRAFLFFPNAAEVVAANSSAITIALAVQSTDFADKFVGARNLSVVAAVFARLPTALAVIFQPGQVIDTPADWLRNVESIVNGDYPFSAWVSNQYWRTPAQGDGVEFLGCETDGLAAFTGYEVIVQPAPMNIGEAGLAVAAALHALLMSGNSVTDGDTVGSDEPDAVRFRMRLRLGTPEEGDHWHVFHPESSADEVELCGPRPERPSVTAMPQGNFLSRLLGKRRDRRSTRH